jgi:YHS domain-containing protein
MRFLTTSIPVLLLSATVIAQMPGRGGPVDALDGLDPVLLVQGKEVPGKSALSTVHHNFTYLFSTAENKATFEKNPANYAIQLGGLCARMGRSTGGNPSDFLVHDGKIYIFGSDECHKRFQAAPAKYIPPPPRPLAKGADAIGKGRKLLDDAARAAGPSIDSVTTLVESISQVQTRPQGEVQIATKTMWSYPDRARQERRMSLMGKTMESSTLMTPDGAWYLNMQGQAYPIAAAGRPSVQFDFGRHPVALLKARRAAGVIVAAEGPAVVEGVKVDRVRFVNAVSDISVNLDARHLIHSVTFQDRNSEGVYGTFTIVYSDYRTVDGLNLPFTVRALFDGQPEPSQSWKVESIAVNRPLDSSLFAAPATKPDGGY